MPCGNEGLVACLHVGNGDETYCPTFQWNETAVLTVHVHSSGNVILLAKLPMNNHILFSTLVRSLYYM